MFRDESEVRIIERDRPSPADGEVLVRTLAVGIDGTDRRVAAGEIGGDPPDGEDHLVIGHEAVGVIEDANDTELEAGTVVAPLVRQPKADTRFAENGELDMAPPDTFQERGIFGAHGYLAEYFTADPESLVTVPEPRSEYGFFIEPASISEKALDQAFAARSAFSWDPEAACVLGNGNLGLLALARLTTGDEFDRTYCLGRRDRPDPTIEFIESVGAMYIDARETDLSDIPPDYEPMDFTFESTGYPRHAIGAATTLGPNGVATLQGVPSSDRYDVDLGDYHSDMVVNNKAVLGVVNSRRSHFETANEWISDIDESVLDELVTGVYDLDEIDAALEDTDETIKSVVSFTR